MKFAREKIEWIKIEEKMKTDGVICNGRSSVKDTMTSVNGLFNGVKIKEINFDKS
jgi:hypothetical protein